MKHSNMYVRNGLYGVDTGNRLPAAWLRLSLIAKLSVNLSVQWLTGSAVCCFSHLGVVGG